MKEKRRDKSKDVSNDSFKITTNENFYRSSNKFNSSQNNFAKKEMYGTLIQNIKLDIQNLQDTISQHSDILIFFKNSKSLNLCAPWVMNRVEEIKASKSQDINNVIDNISLDSQNIEKLADTYGCKSHIDLIPKLAMQSLLFDLYVKKLNDLALVLNLRFNNEKNMFSESIYQDSYSKYNQIKAILEKLIKMSSATNESLQKSGTSYKPVEPTTENNVLLKEASCFEIIVKRSPPRIENVMMTQVEHKEDYKLFELESLEEIYNTRKESSSVTHLRKICDESIQKVNDSLKELCEAYGVSGNSYDSSGRNSLERLNNYRTELESIFSEKDLQISELKRKLAEISPEAYKQKVEEQCLNDFGNRKITGIYEREIDDIVREKNEQIKSLKATIEENNKAIMNIKGLEEKLKTKLYSEIQILSGKSSEYEDKYYLLRNEHDILKKNFEDLSKKIKRGVDAETYEQLLQEQFDEMKKSFMNKIQELNQQLNDLKIDSRRKIYGLEDELKQMSYIKDAFLRQITELKRMKTE